MDSLFNSSFGLTTKQTPKLYITGPLRRESTDDRCQECGKRHDIIEWKRQQDLAARQMSIFSLVLSYGWIQIGVTRLQSRNAQFGSKSAIFLSRVTMEFDKWPWKTISHLLCYFKLCASFHSHWWIQTRVTVWKCSIRVKIGDFPVPPWKLTDDLEKQKGYFYAASNFVMCMHHFIAISEFKLELQSGNAQFESNRRFFFTCVTLKFGGWPWKSIGRLS